MEQTFWEKINSMWSNTYYTTPVVIMCSILAIIIGIKFHRKGKTSILFIIYALCCFILFIGSDLLTALYQYKASPPSRNKSAILQSANTLFGLFELFTFYYYYLQIIKSRVTHWTMKFSFILFFTIVIVFFMKLNDKKFEIFDIRQFSALVATIEFFLLLLPVFICLFELFKNESIKEIQQRPLLWINSGLFIYILVTLPFLIISESLPKPLYFFMYFLHSVSLCILLLSVIKAFLCRKPITT